MNISEEALEALVELIRINERYSHPYYCRAKEIQSDYEERIKPILEPYNKLKIILEAMRERERIYQKCREKDL